MRSNHTEIEISQRGRANRPLLTKQGLIRIRLKAMRRRLWFKALSKMERSIIDLTIRCVERVRSHVLVNTVLNIIDKLLKTLDFNHSNRVEKIGRELAQKLAEIATKWGNSEAGTWKSDSRFIRFLGVNALGVS